AQPPRHSRQSSLRTTAPSSSAPPATISCTASTAARSPIPRRSTPDSPAPQAQLFLSTSSSRSRERRPNPSFLPSSRVKRRRAHNEGPLYLSLSAPSLRPAKSGLHF